MTLFNKLVCGAALAAMLSGALSAQDKGLMHCFLFTPAENVTDAQWQAFYKATEALPKEIPGLQQVWYGELQRPFAQLMLAQGAAEARQKLGAGAESVDANVRQAVRSMGVCMEFASKDAFAKYADRPAHRKWEQAYFPVRRPGTFTFDLIRK